MYNCTIFAYFSEWESLAYYKKKKSSNLIQSLWIGIKRTVDTNRWNEGKKRIVVSICTFSDVKNYARQQITDFALGPKSFLYFL